MRLENHEVYSMILKRSVLVSGEVWVENESRDFDVKAKVWNIKPLADIYSIKEFEKSLTSHVVADIEHTIIHHFKHTPVWGDKTRVYLDIEGSLCSHTVGGSLTRLFPFEIKELLRALHKVHGELFMEWVDYAIKEDDGLEDNDFTVVKELS